MLARKNDRLWERGARALTDGDRDLARESFSAVLERDPEYADALLGLHILDPSTPGLLERMVAAIGRFGEARDRFGIRLHSHYRPLAFAFETLELADDLRRARARELSLAGESAAAATLIDATTACPLSTIAEIGLAFDSGDWQQCLALIQGVGELGGELGLDLLIYRGLALRNLGLMTPAIDSFEIAIARGTPQIRRFASYERAVVLELSDRDTEAQAAFAELYAEDVSYRDVADRVVGAAARKQAEQEGSPETGFNGETHPNDDPDPDSFDAIVAGIEAGLLADDPDLPDNRPEDRS